MVTNSKKNLKRFGKAQAREQFAPIVEGLSNNGGIVEVTDYGKVAAVMMSYQDYLWLLAQAKEPFEPKRQLAGSAVLMRELEAASQQITDSVVESLKKSAHDL
jgi:PHD/YefM family antitoxin component YafN of YafNO toxin-antitoxin module